MTSTGSPAHRPVAQSGPASKSQRLGAPLAEAPGGPTLASNDERAQRILVVEDEALIALDLEQRLLRLGFEVVGVADHRDEALALFREHRPDLVLMDICIRGEVDGIETARELTRIGDVPVIFLTAFADDDTVRRAASIPPYGYLTKPFDERTLTSTIAIALERHRKDTQARLLDAAVGAATIGVLLVDARTEDRRIVYANRAFGAMAGVAPELIAGNQACFLAEDPGDEGVLRLRQALLDRTPAEETIRGKKGSGAAFWSSVALMPVPDRSGGVSHMLVFHRDVTAERTAITALAESQRLEVVGRLSAGIAHDFNNILCAILAFSEFAQEAVTDSSVRSDLDEVVQATRRGALLTRKLLDFARRDSPHAADTTNISRVATDALPMLETLAGTRVRVELRLAVEPLFVPVDVTSIEQILLNLVANARDAMPDGGRIVIETARPDVATPRFAAGQFVRLSVTDTGVGMDEATQQRIFTFLFTTKPRGHGTGLGLTTCQMLVERAGGLISVRSAPGEGATFTIDLPTSVAPQASALAARAEERLGNAGGAWCLLVEPTPTLRRAFARSLASARFELIEASSGDAARRELDARGPELQLVICDSVLPGANAVELLAHARRAAPRAALLVVAGDAAPGPFASDVEVLWKPIGADTLARRALDAIAPFEAAPTREPSVPRKASAPTVASAGTTGRTSSPPADAAAPTWMFEPIVRALDGTVFAFGAALHSAPAAHASDGPRHERTRLEQLAATLRDHPRRFEPIFLDLSSSAQLAELGSEHDVLGELTTRIVLCVNERARTLSIAETVRHLGRLREAGYRIALGGLGAGHADLSWLIELRPDFACIAPSLVRGIEDARLQRQVVGALVDLCRRSHITSVADDVRTSAEARALLDLGCELVRGAAISKPGPALPTGALPPPDVHA